jgi:ATPase components of ABC transporters with duplicated ATPase domains
MLLSAEHLSINFGSRQLLTDVNLYLSEGVRIGVIGVNGTGKSTLLKVLSGAQEPDAGTVSRDPNVQVSYLPQNPEMQDGATVLEQVFLSAPADFRALNEYEAKAMLGKLGIADTEQKIGSLSGGQRKRVALASALIHPADVLILDEPTNHLDSEAVTWLEDWLGRFRGGLLMVTHDRYFLERVVNRIAELSRGKLYLYEANYSRYLELKTEREEMAEATERRRQSILRVEREWIMRGCRARTTKSKDRVARYETLRDQSGPESDGAVQLSAASSRLGRKTVELKDVSKAFDGRTVLSHFSYGVLRSDRIGIVGHNGVGKSTLLRIVAGELAPDSGTVEVGATVKIGHFSQEGRELDLNQRVGDFIRGIAEEIRTDEGTFTASQMMERFLFTGDLQAQTIGRLSGGERRRLYLLSVLMEAPNLLLLDEPTNDLDVTTLAILEDYLQSFPGPILAVSHDRWFLDKLAASIFEVRDGGQVLRYSGNWSDWAEKRREEETPEKAAPARREVEKPREKKLKFTYAEQLEFQSIDAELAKLESCAAECRNAMGGCGSDYVKLGELQEKLEGLESALEEKTERWMYLNELKEKIDAQE